MIAERNIQLEQEREKLVAELIKAERRRNQKQEKAEELLAKARQERQAKGRPVIIRACLRPKALSLPLSC